MRLSFEKLLSHLYFGVLALLGYDFKLIERVLRDFIDEVVHDHVGLENVPEELLGVGPCLRARPCLHIVFNSLPIFAVQLNSLEKSHVLHEGPSPIF